MSTPAYQVRPAQVADTAGIAQEINTSFGFLLDRQLPHLMRPARIGQHFVAEAEGRIVAVAGCYPHGWRVGSVTFAVAGVGQVSTLPEWRGQGAMSAILNEVVRVAGQQDFAWLGGDRQRYGNYGWAVGGWKYVFDIAEKTLPAPPPAARRFDPATDLPLLQAALDRAPQTGVFPPEELALMFTADRGPLYLGWVLGESLLLLHAKRACVLLGEGRTDELSALLAVANAWARQQPQPAPRLNVECSVEPSPLLHAAYRHYTGMRVSPSHSLRLGRLDSFFAKFAQVVAERGGVRGTGELALRNRDDGQGVVLRCSRGRLQVRPGLGAKGVELTTTELSELVFGLTPLDVVLPGLALDSPFRNLFPFRVHLSEFFWL